MSRTLTDELQRMYGSSNPHVRLSIEVQNVKLGLDTALPCGLIVNELVSNSYKYGFPDGRTGSISVRMRTIEQGSYELIVEDNGVGVPDGEKMEREGSLGMRLVTTLVRQINGNIDRSGDVGLTTTIQFEESQYKQRV